MANSSTGKWVQRAGATGGGKGYRSQAPTNWYAALVLIVILGAASVVYSRYEYQHKSSTSAPTVEPAVGTTWYAGVGFSICGHQQNSPPANANKSLVGLYTTGNGVITIAPKTAAEAGNNATLGKFVADYPGMELTTSTLRYPGGKVYKNGETCPTGTPDAGKKGVVQVENWSNVEATKGTLVTGDPRSLKLAQSSLVTLAFAPKGATLPKPAASVILAVLKAGAGTTPSSTSSSLPVVPSSSTPSSSTPSSSTPASSTPSSSTPSSSTPASSAASTGKTAIPAGTSVTTPPKG